MYKSIIAMVADAPTQYPILKSKFKGKKFYPYID